MDKLGKKFAKQYLIVRNHPRGYLLEDFCALQNLVTTTSDCVVPTTRIPQQAMITSNGIFVMLGKAHPIGHYTLDGPLGRCAGASNHTTIALFPVVTFWGDVVHSISDAFTFGLL